MFWLSESAGMRAGIRDARIVVAPTSAPIQAINRYWDTKRAGRFAPRRADIDPAEITAHMPNLMLIDVLRDGDYRYRLIGTAFTDGKGKNATGKRLTEVFAAQPEVVRLFKARFGAGVGDRSPLFSAGNVYWESKPDELRLFECGYFPLSDDGETVNMILMELLIYWPGEA